VVRRTGTTICAVACQRHGTPPADSGGEEVDSDWWIRCERCGYELCFAEEGVVKRVRRRRPSRRSPVRASSQRSQASYLCSDIAPRHAVVQRCIRDAR